ncbi:hypothetical protein ISU10_18505 [Nocardioides agariphilus]|uniref:MFS transporter n=1 Tax=Nocardioides agariphilus TaxID=433664 RepID=A0A930YIJ1_9ACTN|nr:hypothetical protein [Nocardioides agariphilus]
MVSGLLGACACLAAVSLIDTGPELGALLFVAGACGASVNVTSGRVVLRSFDPSARGLAMGIRQTSPLIGMGLAALLLPPTRVDVRLWSGALGARRHLRGRRVRGPGRHRRSCEARRQIDAELLIAVLHTALVAAAWRQCPPRHPADRGRLLRLHLPGRRRRLELIEGGGGDGCRVGVRSRVPPASRELVGPCRLSHRTDAQDRPAGLRRGATHGCADAGGRGDRAGRAAACRRSQLGVERPGLHCRRRDRWTILGRSRPGAAPPVRHHGGNPARHGARHRTGAVWLGVPRLPVWRRWSP